MAKKSKIARQRQREALVARHAEHRAELKKAASNIHLPLGQRMEASRALSRLPRDSSRVRLRNRDSIDGRPRGHLRKFGLSRVNVRDKALKGELPGITKSSW